MHDVRAISANDREQLAQGPCVTGRVHRARERSELHDGHVRDRMQAAYVGLARCQPPADEERIEAIVPQPLGQQQGLMRRSTDVESRDDAQDSRPRPRSQLLYQLTAASRP